MQVVLGWYFGDSEIGGKAPILVGSHMEHTFCTCCFRRALIGGDPIQIVLPPTAQQKEGMPRFSNKKCSGGDAPGRWINMIDKQCEPPYCTGNLSATIHTMDWVSACVAVCGSAFACVASVDVCVFQGNLRVHLLLFGCV